MYTLKKSLGQHFLKDEEICKRIINELKQCSFKNLVEVGPGGGALTRYILELEGINFKAVEIDEEKVEYLKHTYPVLADKIISESILDTEKPFDEPFTV